MPILPSYRASGQWSPLVFALVPVGMIAAAAVGAVYQKLIGWIPLIILDALCIIGLAIGLAFIAAIVVKLGRCRSSVIGAIVGTLIGVIGLAGAYEMGRRDFQSQLISELSASNIAEMKEMANEIKHVPFSAYIDFRVESGWSIGSARHSKLGGIPIDGAFVYVIWTLEGLIAIGAGAFGGFGSAKKPFCEACTQWATTPKTLWTARKTSQETILEVLKAPDLESMAIVAGGGRGLPTTALNFKLAQCPACKTKGFLTIEQETTSLDKDGKEKKNTVDLQSHLEVDATEAERVLAGR